MIKNRYIGKFWIPLSVINDRPSEVLDITRTMIIIEAKIDPCTDSVEYTAIDPSLFKPVPVGVRCLLYRIIYDAEKKKCTAEKVV